MNRRKTKLHLRTVKMIAINTSLAFRPLRKEKLISNGMKDVPSKKSLKLQEMTVTDYNMKNFFHTANMYTTTVLSIL